MTLNEMSPYLLLGFLIAGVLHVYVPRTLYSRFFHRKGFGSVAGAALLGVPLPLCSCGVIPAAVGLRREGASEGATVSFLVATPQTGVDSILVTYSLFGLPFAIIRPVASFLVALFSGVMVDKYGANPAPQIDYSKVTFGAPTYTTADAHCACGCGCDHSHHGEQPKSIWAVLKYSFVDMMTDYGKWLVVGLLIAAAITVLIPDSFFELFKEYYLLNILAILIISTPMYICATGSTPVALSLILKGVSPGAAFVLLMAGPATNIASLIILRKEIGKRKTIIYLISIVVGAIACALVIDFVLPQEWFSFLTPLGDALHHGHDHDHSCELCTHGPLWWQWLCSGAFVVLFANAMVRKALKKRRC